MAARACRKTRQVNCRKGISYFCTADKKPSWRVLKTTTGVIQFLCAQAHTMIQNSKPLVRCAAYNLRSPRPAQAIVGARPRDLKQLRLHVIHLLHMRHFVIVHLIECHFLFRRKSGIKRFNGVRHRRHMLRAILHHARHH